MALSVAGTASAQEPSTVQLSQSQLELNAHAIQLIQDDRLDEAVKVFESSLTLGEANITFLNLGRTLSKLDRCSEADAAYAKVMSAPRVPEPTAEQIQATLDRYREDLSQCGVEVSITCDPPELQVRVDDGEVQACPSEPLRVDAGRHTIAAIRNDGVERKQTVEAQSGGSLQMVLVVPDEPVEDTNKPVDEVVQDTPPPPAEEKLPEGAKIGGWALVGTGGALLLTAGVLDVFVITPQVDDFKANPRVEEPNRSKIRGLQTVGRVLIPVGALTAAAGAGILLFYPRESQPRVSIGPAGASATWTF